MNQHQWQPLNDRYLQAAFGWLRARFACFLCQRAPNGQPPKVASQLAARLAETDHVRLQFEAASAPTLSMLIKRFRTGEDASNADRQQSFEQALLLLCIGVELDPMIARACQEASGQGYPTFSLAQQLFQADASVVQRAMAAERPLRYFQLLEIFQPNGVSLAESRLSASEWVISLAQGRYVLDELLTRVVVALDLPGQEADYFASASQHEPVDALIDRGLLETLRHDRPVIQLIGPDSFSKQQVARYLIDQYRQRFDADIQPALFRMPSDSLPRDPIDLATFVRLWSREVVWANPFLYLDLHNLDLDQPDRKERQVVRKLIERTSGLILLDTRTMPPALDRRTITIEVGKPTTQEQYDAWCALRNDDAARLASQFDLDLGTISRILMKGGGSERAWNLCLEQTRPRLDRLAQRVEAKAELEHVQLPAVQKRLLVQIADQVQQRYRVYDDWGFRERMNRGLGISVLFAGDSGTGKTMSAEAIANQLDLPLYRIDLSAVVSKYIGETEKNLRRMFDAFESGGAVLLFDEADSLFGKRSEVKDSHDRYANIQIDYLLQRMEAFSGLAILATNMKSALDEAFLRRLRFIVDFPLPGPKERLRIWQSVFPVKKEFPVEALDFVKLAQFNLTGGHIQTIAINAASLAAAEPHKSNRVLTMRHVLEATKNEFRKLARPINDADFRWQPNPQGELASV